MVPLTYSKFTPVYRVCAIIALAFLTACQTASGTFCDIAKPQRPSAAEVEMLSDAQITALLEHNTRGQRLCGWKP